MKKVLIVGAGKIGMMIGALLTETEMTGVAYDVTIADQNEAAFGKLSPQLQQRATVIDVANGVRLRQQMAEQDVVINALPFFLTEQVATAAADSGCHYLDLTEDVKSTQRVRELADAAQTAFIPQCGLAPGFISIVAHHMAQDFDELRDLQLRVGALPQFPSNALKYNLTWSTDGVVNEYLHPCEAVVNGEQTLLPALADLRTFSLDGIEYECFNTSGGLGSLTETLAGKVQNLSYQTIRYPGHRGIMRLLIDDLQLRQNPELLKQILEEAVPATMQDVVLIHVSAIGEKNGRLLEETYSRKIYSREIGGETWSAIQITTASGICAVLDLLCEGKLPQQGFVKQEAIPFEMFINNRFGRNYDAD